jgi:hypothetical protein
MGHIIIVVALVLGVLGAPPAKVELCHKDQPITVAAPAVAAHLAHGDRLGDCSPEGGIGPAEEPPPEPEPEIGGPVVTDPPPVSEPIPTVAPPPPAAAPSGDCLRWSTWEPYCD